jgi:hypothetical protein
VAGSVFRTIRIRSVRRFVFRITKIRLNRGISAWRIRFRITKNRFNRRISAWRDPLLGPSGSALFVGSFFGSPRSGLIVGSPRGGTRFSDHQDPPCSSDLAWGSAVRITKIRFSCVGFNRRTSAWDPLSDPHDRFLRSSDPRGAGSAFRTMRIRSVRRIWRGGPLFGSSGSALFVGSRVGFVFGSPRSGLFVGSPRRGLRSRIIRIRSVRRISRGIRDPV